MIFRIHTSGRPDLKDWDISEEMGASQISKIPDTLLDGASAKMGSSIPSPFARLYLFETAFRIVQQDQLEGNTMYHQLVGECLDFFKFLFYFAEDDMLRIMEWNKHTQLRKMQHDGDQENTSQNPVEVKAHKKLAEAFNIFFNTTNFSGVQRIHLIKYGDVLIGGTSPLTILYTSPNWTRKLKERGWEYHFKTPNGVGLFSGATRSIFDHRSDVDYVRYMYRLVYAHRNRIPVLYDYFFKAAQDSRIQTILSISPSVDLTYSLERFKDDYDLITYKSSNGAPLFLSQSGCTLGKPLKKALTNTVQQSDFLIASNRSTEPKPLVLVSGGHSNKYLYKKWDSKTYVEDNQTIPLEERVLPESNIKYPYLTTGDFLESKLVEMKFNLNRNNFFTGYTGDFRYLLPIKKQYFKYFSIDDLKKQLTITQTGNMITVTLKVPIQNGDSINLERVYTIKQQQTENEDHQARDGFNVGVFPFYRVKDREDLNRYSVGVVSYNDKVKLSFYSVEHTLTEVSSNSKVRTSAEDNKYSISTSFYTVDQKSFDFIQVLCDGLNGLIIPELKDIYINKLKQTAYVAIDLGTSNTHISYSDSSEGVISDFEITHEDRQMVFLSEIRDIGEQYSLSSRRIQLGFGEVILFYSFFSREFMQSYLGPGSHAEFPIRTVLCEHPEFNGNESELFHDANIGMYFEVDSEKDRRSFRYSTDIKWAFESLPANEARARLKLYTEHVLWMIKNKLLLNKRWLTPSIVWMYPKSMGEYILGEFDQIWKEQADKIFGKGEYEIDSVTESIAPYYRLNGLKGVSLGLADNVIIVDIGGGTTDVLFKYGKDSTMSTSFRFAGNDIWGDGIRLTEAKRNGFISLVRKKLDGTDDVSGQSSNEGISTVSAYYENPGIDSASLISLLFKYDEIYKFRENVRANSAMRYILFVHYAAVIYQIVKILKIKGLPAPHTLVFTGKGSLYLKLIASRIEGIEKITKNLLASFYKEDMPTRFSIVIPDRPKQVTAEGALKYIRKEKEMPEFKIEYIFDIVHAGIDDDQKALNDFRVKDLDSLSLGHKAFFDGFIDSLKSQDIRDMLREFDLKQETDSLDILEQLSLHANDSYSEMLARALRAEPDIQVKDSPFFWHLKQSIYDVCKLIVK